MKCELCHEKDAALAINVTKDGEEEELYVCKECARRERVKRQKKSQRAYRVTEVSGGDVPPPVIEALMGAMDGLVGALEQHIEENEAQREKDEADAKAKEDGNRADDGKDYLTFPCERANERFRIGSRIHLEGLSLIGDLDAVKRAVCALGLRLRGVSLDGLHDAGHAYELLYQGSSERARRVAEDLLTQERNARVRLVEEMPRVFGDSLCRALAILKSCRLLSPGELFDLLSPLRLAAQEGLLDGLTIKELQKITDEIDLSSEGEMDPDVRDRVDAERADDMNARFEDVVFNERAEGKFL